ncbi:MAG: hypothetical protein HN846_03170 [Candidatus Pacebacteria bacterium]|jgi:hypothetical protein|nr:hypothetical protein [Candidatus Paceibacterota bacterium]MBT4005087.1 hypothetical protein [Candidatus Paceibacterota bacterium]MBT4358932.1 hypothetical protein [Candidatus Paceibacterota bacterium]MBT4680801.1 hypothetical protein [Candidatus Paceibacterota bacterium]MBT6898768.1 hypothetical protein [Candidatus Paceibacterota bacterium]
MSARSRQLSSLLHAIIMTIGIGLVYWWLHIPSLQPYSFQAFAIIGLLYFLVKGLSKGKAWHILPAFMSIETVLATMSFLLLIGATGNTSSWFYPLTYIHLFFIVFSSHVGTSIAITMMIMLFHYGLTPNLIQHDLVSLLTLPIIMAFFIFAKLQHEEVIEDKLIIEEEEVKLDKLESEEFQLQNFLKNFLEPKISQLEKLLEHPNNSQSVKGQLHLVKLEIEKVLNRISSSV